MRLIAEFHLASNSLSGAINGRIIPKLMQKCSHLTSRNHFNGTEYFPLVKILLTDLMSCSSKNQLHSALCASWFTIPGFNFSDVVVYTENNVFFAWQWRFIPKSNTLLNRHAILQYTLHVSKHDNVGNGTC